MHAEKMAMTFVCFAARGRLGRKGVVVFLSFDCAPTGGAAGHPSGMCGKLPAGARLERGWSTGCVASRRDGGARAVAGGDDRGASIVASRSVRGACESSSTGCVVSRDDDGARAVAGGAEGEGYQAVDVFTGCRSEARPVEGLEPPRDQWAHVWLEDVAGGASPKVVSVLPPFLIAAWVLAAPCANFATGRDSICSDGARRMRSDRYCPPAWGQA